MELFFSVCCVSLITQWLGEKNFEFLWRCDGGFLEIFNIGT
jgi:hypothetical protein